MTHNTEDELLGYALELIASDEERARITAHLEACSQCRERLENLRKDIQIIGGVKPRRQVLAIPYPRTRQFVAQAIFRAAAFVVLGFLAGLGASSWAPREPVFVSPTYVELSSPSDGLAAHTASDATEIPAEYYEQLVESTE
ncbi:MAG: hypothetical protein AMJ46_03510 [Latescibacteria bacterium DG_63]|nr:MAG: hypothetical protein AMJ46_03510 [Latescibacteria bacterium DG_63]